MIGKTPGLDYIEITGPGEVALNADLHWLIAHIRKVTSLPIAISSCGSLCWRISVHNDFNKVNAVSLRLDSADRVIYHTINQFQQQIPFERYITGIKNFRQSFQGDFYLTVCLIDKINTGGSALYRLTSLVNSLTPKAVFLTSSDVVLNNEVIPALSEEQLKQLVTQFGPEAQILTGCAQQVLYT